MRKYVIYRKREKVVFFILELMFVFNMQFFIIRCRYFVFGLFFLLKRGQYQEVILSVFFVISCSGRVVVFCVVYVRVMFVEQLFIILFLCREQVFLLYVQQCQCFMFVQRVGSIFLRLFVALLGVLQGICVFFYFIACFEGVLGGNRGTQVFFFREFSSFSFLRKQINVFIVRIQSGDVVFSRGRRISGCFGWGFGRGYWVFGGVELVWSLGCSFGNDSRGCFWV